MRSVITVAIPVLDAGPRFRPLLEAVRAQRIDAEIELVVCDSGSRDGSAELAGAHGATVIEIERREFSHGATRNLLMQRSAGDHVAFLTQDAEPADDQWLSRLLSGFILAADVGLVFGPYVPQPDASPMVMRELTTWFAGFAPDGRPRIDRLSEGERNIRPRDLLGPRGFFTDANGCIAREAWRDIPFREIPYAEDHALAHDMLRAGFAKVYLPEAAVIHSHEYSTAGWLQRAFDEGRALHGLYGWREPLHPITTALNVWGRIGADWRWARAQPDPPQSIDAARLLLAATTYEVARTVGGVLGTRADRLPVGLARWLSRERPA